MEKRVEGKEGKGRRKGKDKTTNRVYIKNTETKNLHKHPVDKVHGAFNLPMDFLLPFYEVTSQLLCH